MCPLAQHDPSQVTRMLTATALSGVATSHAAANEQWGDGDFKNFVAQLKLVLDLKMNRG